MTEEEKKMEKLLYYLFDSDNITTVDDWGPFWNLFWYHINVKKPFNETFLREIQSVVSLNILLKRHCKDLISEDFKRQFKIL